MKCNFILTQQPLNVLQNSLLFHKLPKRSNSVFLVAVKYSLWNIQTYIIKTRLLPCLHNVMQYMTVVAQMYTLIEF